MLADVAVRERFLRDGFAGQRLHVLPRPLVRDALSRPPTSRLLPTDAGFFPYAAAHGRSRPHGSREAVVMLCAGGRGAVDHDARQHPVRTEDVVLLPPNVSHAYRADAADPWSIWWLHVTGSDLDDLVTAIGLTVDAPVGRLVHAGPVVSLAESVCDHLGRDETAASLTAAAGAAWHLLALLAARRSGTVDRSEPVRQAQSYLRSHLADADADTVPALARRVGLSTSHLAARFRAETGFSVTEYRKRLRMARARELLMATDLSVAEIATAVGYSDAFYFSRQFSSVNALSPRTFRRTAFSS